jgi:hypothetical protein
MPLRTQLVRTELLVALVRTKLLETLVGAQLVWALLARGAIATVIVSARALLLASLA